ncbi:glutamate--cysteine ligase [Psychromonas sp. MB-3u-54]|uniref:glutamate--cysteine ligase n=1 Tax=Psychromonas sp. MB-3u-54 TaxID=2058319 RepID=UPI000C321FBA|nr:glutamate--cysteine ligase [Psychromonas sp. MB-3u-54]PKH02227.1 glutamate--cysteine ligase [Psychromonas sp. MB-3u-54]
MSDLYQARLQRLMAPESFPFLTRIQRGIEKEGLRVTSQAAIAQSSHPQALGSALMHGSITTDYSEALLEFITPVNYRIDDSIDYLSDLHNFTLRNLKGEYLWPASMPCRLAGDESIPIAQYGSSNIGQMKHIYRQGLAHRYGRTMQSIAGIHYNFSMSEDFWPYCQQLWGEKGDLQAFKSQRYFDLIRNFRRHSWLLTYLFGASPVFDRSFMNNDKPHKLSKLNEHTLGLPFATSLRMSDLGYQSKAQSELNISYNDLDSYIQGLTQAIQQPHSEYEKIGRNINGQRRQLNANILQIENEYYSDIRPKRVTKAGEKPMTALKERGVEYVEVRILDTNPFLPVGIDAQQIRFLDVFLLYCLLSDSPELTLEEQKEIKYNQQQVIQQGRKPGLMLKKNGQSVAFKAVANELLAEIEPLANLLELAHKSQPNDHLKDQCNAYTQALSAQVNKVNHSELTPSGIIMEEINKGHEFTESMLRQAKKNQEYFTCRGLSDAMNDTLQLAATESIFQQQQLEASEDSTFDEFLQRHNASS